jgi:hypothetical protein
MYEHGSMPKVEVPMSIQSRSGFLAPYQRCFQKEIGNYGADLVDGSCILTNWTLHPSHDKFMDALVDASLRKNISKMEWSHSNQNLCMTFTSPIVIDEETVICNACFWY